MKKRVGKVTFKVVAEDREKGVSYTVNANAKGDWSIGCLMALKEYIDEMLKDVKKKVKDENRRK